MLPSGRVAELVRDAAVDHSLAWRGAAALRERALRRSADAFAPVADGGRRAPEGVQLKLQLNA